MARLGQRGVEGYELAMFFQGFLKVLPGAAGLYGAGEVLPGMFDDSVEARQIKVDVCLGGVAPRLFGTSTDGG